MILTSLFFTDSSSCISHPYWNTSFLQVIPKYEVVNRFVSHVGSKNRLALQQEKGRQPCVIMAASPCSMQSVQAIMSTKPYLWCTSIAWDWAACFFQWRNENQKTLIILFVVRPQNGCIVLCHNTSKFGSHFWDQVCLPIAVPYSRDQTSVWFLGHNWEQNRVLVSDSSPGLVLSHAVWVLHLCPQKAIIKIVKYCGYIDIALQAPSISVTIVFICIHIIWQLSYSHHFILC